MQDIDEENFETLELQMMTSLKYSGFSQKEIEQFISNINGSPNKELIIDGLFGNPDGIPAMLDEKYRAFHQYVQGVATNHLATTKTRRSTIVEEDWVKEENRVEILVENKFQLNINDYDSLKDGIPPFALQLLDCFLIQYTEKQIKQFSVDLPLSKYMEMRGLASKTSARRQVEEGMKILKQISFKLNDKNVKGEIYLCGGTCYINNSIIHFNFNPDFYVILMNYAVMNYSKETLQLNTMKNPYSYHISRYIDLNYRMNEGKDRVHTIRMETLMNKIPNLPDYINDPEIKRRIYIKIIVPLLRDFKVITHVTISIYVNNKLVEDPKIYFKGRNKVQEFLDSKVWIDYKDYPKNTKRINKKSNRNRFEDS